MEKAIEIKSSWSQLAKDAARAKNLGISYGQLKGMEFEKQQAEAEKLRKAAEEKAAAARAAREAAQTKAKKAWCEASMGDEGAELTEAADMRRCPFCLYMFVPEREDQTYCSKSCKWGAFQKRIKNMQ